MVSRTLFGTAALNSRLLMGSTVSQKLPSFLATLWGFVERVPKEIDVLGTWPLVDMALRSPVPSPAPFSEDVSQIQVLIVLRPFVL